MACGTKVNEDLVRERKKCTFNVQELIHLIDGGESETTERKKIEDMVLSVKELRDEVPEEYLSHKEKYENAVRKTCILVDVLKRYHNNNNSMDDFKPSNKYHVQLSVTREISPFFLHMGMFIPTLLNQTSDEQRMKWLPKAWNMQIIGTYAQTELGHGTFIRGLETTATYDPKTEEFVLHSPTLTSYKWWPGGLAHTTNHCIVVAQLYTNGKCYGVHPFFVQIRDFETHIPLPGIKVGEIGPKMGFQTANNGFLGFNNFRIPRTNMLMKNAQVLKDGSYVKGKNDKLTYGTMVFVRVTIVSNVAYYLGMAATIAVRYAAVRHQSQIKPNQPEPPIIEYVTQQHKIFITIATSHVMRLAGHWLWDTFSRVTSEMQAGNMDQLPELHALACCLKAVCSKEASIRVDECRQACGGHGYMTSSRLPVLTATVQATITYEGEFTVLMLQTARFLVKAWKQASNGKVMTPTVAYLVKRVSQRWQNSAEGIVRGFQEVAAGKVKEASEALQRHLNTGVDHEDAWNLSSVQLVNASEAHCRAVMVELAVTEVQKLRASVSRELGDVLQQLVDLYLVYWALERRGDLLLYSNISKDDVMGLQQKYEELLALIRPNAVSLVDGFDIRDEILNSTLGASDGRVYERLMEEAMKSPLNQEPVNKSFHQYIKPLMNKAKL